MTNVIVKNAFKDCFQILIPLFRSTNFVKPKPRARTTSRIAELPNLEHVAHFIAKLSANCLQTSITTIKMICRGKKIILKKIYIFN